MAQGSCKSGSYIMEKYPILADGPIGTSGRFSKKAVRNKLGDIVEFSTGRSTISMGRVTRLTGTSGKILHRRIGMVMNTNEQIQEYISSLPEPKRSDVLALHQLTLQLLPGCRLWFSDGKNSEGKTVSNPNIGYGFYTIKYADGTTREFFQIGLSANKTGISVYILGLEDKTYLAKTFGKTIGKASVTGYCIRFKTIKDIDTAVLQAAIRYGVEAHNESAG